MSAPAAEPRPIRIATRGSALALAQARLVLARCRAAFPRLRFELRILKTTGDKLQTASMANPAPGLPKGLFTKELEAALLRGEADLAVHSLKDLPTAMPAGLRLAGVLEREDPRDVLVLRTRGRRRPGSSGAALPELPRGGVVATSSTRRAAQLRALRPDLRLVEIRGNVPTRLQKLAADSGLHGTILAAAGLARLGIGRDARECLVCPPDLAASRWERDLPARLLTLGEMLPAVGQAAIGLQARSGDRRTGAVCRRLDHRATRLAVEAERAFLEGFGGGCHSPVAALATVRGDRLTLAVRAFEGDREWHDRKTVPVREGQELGRRLGRVARRALGAV
jgi:hydroxymethylbilane synthase